uniref:Uncharacterized protein n=1 Tax=Chrysotila carterae TaxID=13221 RepID=A0A7S4C0B6_CHRCT
MSVRDLLFACDLLGQSAVSKQISNGLHVGSVCNGLVQSPCCVRGSQWPAAFPAEAKLLFLGAGSTGTTSAAQMCQMAGRRSLHSPRWQEMLQKGDFKALQRAWDTHSCFSDGLVDWQIKLEELDAGFSNSGLRSPGGVVYILNSRPLLPWLVSRLSHALSVPKKTSTAWQLHTALRRDGMGGLVTYLRDLADLRARKHQSILDFRSRNGRVFVLDITSKPGQEALAAKLGLAMNKTIKKFSDNKYRRNPSEGPASSNARPDRLNVDPDTAVVLAQAGFNLTSLREVQELVASVLLVKYSVFTGLKVFGGHIAPFKQLELDSSGSQLAALCACQNGFVAV